MALSAGPQTVRRLLRSSHKQNWLAVKSARGKTGGFGHGYWRVRSGDPEGVSKTITWVFVKGLP